jgi:tRNA nucleotidyltransferase/poly(A) polymerase
VATNATPEQVKSLFRRSRSPHSAPTWTTLPRSRFQVTSAPASASSRGSSMR